MPISQHDGPPAPNADRAALNTEHPSGLLINDGADHVRVGQGGPGKSLFNQAGRKELERGRRADSGLLVGLGFCQ